MQSVTEFFKEENDFLYRKGFKKGFEKGRNEENFKYVANLITLSDLPDQKLPALPEYL